MALKSLLEPIIEDGIKNTHYFEGRLLSAADLRDQQDANRRHHRQLGTLAGYGIVDGLGVTVQNKGDAGNSPVVRISGGKAVNLEGDVLELPLDYIDIELSRILQSAAADATVFQDCDVGPSQSLAPSGAGLYVLVMSPSSQYQGYALKSGLQSNGVAHQCGRAYIVEGVVFRLVQFDPLAMPDLSDATKNLLQNQVLSPSNPILSDDYQNLSKLQNSVAHICFGSERSPLSQTSAFNTVANPVAGLDALLGNDLGLDQCDVPVAMIYWTLDGIGFVDNWAVKRKVYPYLAADADLPFSEQRSTAVFEAMLYQFQEQIDNLLLQNLSASELLNVSAADYFQYLPPAGVIPLYNVDYNGFTPQNFFVNQPHRDPLYISESQARTIIYQCAAYAPISTNEAKLVWLYKTWQRAFFESQGTFSIPHIIFTSGNAPYFATPRFDVSRWDYANYISYFLGP